MIQENRKIRSSKPFSPWERSGVNIFDPVSVRYVDCNTVSKNAQVYFQRIWDIWANGYLPPGNVRPKGGHRYFASLQVGYLKMLTDEAVRRHASKMVLIVDIFYSADCLLRSAAITESNELLVNIHVKLLKVFKDVYHHEGRARRKGAKD